MNRQNGSPAAATPPEPKSQEHARGTKIPPTHWTRLNTSKTPEAFEFDSPLATPGRRETASCGFNAGHHAANRNSTPTSQSLSQSFTDIARPKHTPNLPAPQNSDLGRQLPTTNHRPVSLADQTITRRARVCSSTPCWRNRFNPEQNPLPKSNTRRPMTARNAASKSFNLGKSPEFCSEFVQKFLCPPAPFAAPANPAKYASQWNVDGRVAISTTYPTDSG